jgi:CBS domain-containing protein
VIVMKAIVKDVMSTQPVTVPETATVKQVAARLREYRVSGLPVLDRDGRVAGVVAAAGRLTGIISRTDVLAVYDRLDEDIRVEIISQVIPRLSEPSWYSVIVADSAAAGVSVGGRSTGGR